MKEHDNFYYMTIRKLDINKEEDKQLVNDYWTKVNETDQVERRFAVMQSILIRYLNFGANNINDDCSLNLALLVKKYIFLKVLILYQNNFKNYGMSIIMSEIKKHIYLKFLDISWNLIGTNLNENPPTQEELIKDYKDKNQKSKKS